MEESPHTPDEPLEPVPPELQALLDQFKDYAVWHPRLVQVQTHLLHTIWEPADVAHVVVCGPSGVGKSKLAEVLARRLNTPKSALNGHSLRRALLINTRPSDGALFHRTNFYQKGLALFGTYDLLPFCNLDGQMARRGSEIHFAPYHMEDDNDCQAFRNAFSSLLKQIPLKVDHDRLLQRWWYFFEGSLGCIGILKQWLVRAL